MKTKIIYISGGETFEIKQIRAAFDEVRNVLGLDEQTVLFGVPVDCDSALSENITTTDTEQTVCDIQQPTEITPDLPKESPEPESIIYDNTEIIQDTTIPSEHVDVADVVDKETTEINSDTVIPILSVLASKKSDDVPEITDPENTIPTAEIETTPTVDTSAEQPTETVVISDIKIDTELVAPVADDDKDVEKITIGDMIEDDAPVAPVEKTLEQLLESMTPLREDIATHAQQPDMNDEWNTDENFAESDTDATLAQLASEFAENQDKIVASPKAESHGKIGKLKNILPFKKAKRDDSSLMGDLFGWAGVAANDDDFSIPEFFTQARKQGS